MDYISYGPDDSTTRPVPWALLVQAFQQPGHLTGADGCWLLSQIAWSCTVPDSESSPALHPHTDRPTLKSGSGSPVSGNECPEPVKQPLWRPVDVEWCPRAIMAAVHDGGQCP